VRKLSLFRIVVAAAIAGVLAPPASAADSSIAVRMTGVWQLMSRVTSLQTDQGNSPPLLPKARALYDVHRAQLAKGDRSFDSTAQCLPHGVPRLLFESMPFELLPQAKNIVFMYQWNRLARFADLKNPHSEPLGPTWLGQSVAKWEGDTLVVDTNGFNDRTTLDAAGMPHSDQLHVIEHYTLSGDGNTLTAKLTIADPQTFSAPWQTSVRFKRLRDFKIPEDVCVERLRLDQYK
jgi:hypothetical protein